MSDPIPTNTAMFALLGDTDASGFASAALKGDPVARHNAAVDYLQEKGYPMVPFEIGEKHLIQTETLYWIGEIEAIDCGFVVLKDASWVHWTGRLGTLCKRLNFDAKGWPSGQQRPRTEFIGDGVRVSLSKVVASIRKDWKLPTESITS